MKPSKKRVFLYCRNSTLQQEFLFQINSLESYYNTRNDVDIIETIGEKISGFKSEYDRPEMNRLLKMVDAGLVDEIAVNSFDRLSRAAINLQTICLHCAEKGVNIFFKSQNLNTLDEFGNFNPIVKLIISILSQFAEMDANNLKIKLVQGKTNKAKLQQYVGGTLPIGYTYINDLENKTKKIVINEDEKTVVEYIFNSFVNEQKSLNQIANNLNNLKEVNSKFLPNKLNRKYNMWHISVIRNILTCTWYSQGFRIWKEEKIMLDNELIFIDADIFNRAQELLDENKRKLKPSTHSYTLNEILYCSCGEKMRPKTSTSVKSYLCSNILKRDLNKNMTCPDGKSISIEKVENAVWLMLKNKISDFRVELEQKENKATDINTKIESNNKLIESIKNKIISELKETRKRTINVFAKFGGDDSELESTINSIDNQIKQQEKIISELKSDNIKLLYSIENLDIAAEIENNLKLIEVDKSLIKFYINKLISKITVCGGLNGKWDTILRIEFNDNINNNHDVYLFFNSLVKNPLYYFISSTATNNIKWNIETKTFNIKDLNNNQYIEKSIDDLQVLLTNLYSENIEKEIPTFIYSNYNLVLESQFKTTDNDLKELSIVDKLNTNTMDFQPLFPINMGVGKLEIVTPFK